ncbi:AF4/FMR2 family member 1, partial [Galemys pyrenaicus]
FYYFCSSVASCNSLYNEDRNLLRIREKERRNQEAHQEKEAFPEKIPLFGEPYKTEKGDELSSRIQNMLGNYEEVTEFFSTKSHPQRSDASENRLGKQRYPLFPEKGSSIPSHSFHTSVHHQPVNTPASGPLPVGNMSHNPKMAQPRMEPMSSLHVKSYCPSDSQHLTQDRLGQEGCGSSHPKKGDHRAGRGDHCASVTDSAPARELSPLLSSLPSPVPPLSPVHSNQQSLPRTLGSNKLHSSNSNNKGFYRAKSPKDLTVKVHERETPQDSLVAVASLGVAPPQPPSQAFPQPPLPSKCIAMQQKPTAYVRPMDGQDQAPSGSPELKRRPEDYRQQTFEKTDLKVPAKAKLTKLKMPSQSVEVSGI